MIAAKLVEIFEVVVLRTREIHGENRRSSNTFFHRLIMRGPRHSGDGVLYISVTRDGISMGTSS